MSRFLARALTAARAEAPQPKPVGPAPEGFGGYGGFGERDAAEKPKPVAGPAEGFGGFRGFGERAENENQPLRAPFTWPEEADFHLTRDAARLSGLILAGTDWRWCPDGGIDVVKPDGRTWMLSPGLAQRLQAADLLPAAVREASP